MKRLSILQLEIFLLCESCHFCPDFDRLGEVHLHHMIRLFTSESGMDNFRCEMALEIFLAKKDRRDVELTGADGTRMVSLVLETWFY